MLFFIDSIVRVMLDIFIRLVETSLDSIYGQVICSLQSSAVLLFFFLRNGNKNCKIFYISLKKKHRTHTCTSTKKSIKMVEANIDATCRHSLKQTNHFSIN